MIPVDVIILTPREKMRRIVKHAASDFKISERDIMNGEQLRSVVNARREAIRRIKLEFPNMSIEQISRFFNLERTTILHNLGWTKAAKSLGICAVPRKATSRDATGR